MAIVEHTGSTAIDRIVEYLGNDAESLLSFTCRGIPKDQVMVPGPDHVAAAWGLSDRKPPVLVNLQRLYGSGRLANTGYLSILPVDQGVEHSGAASFATNPAYFDPDNIVRLAIEGGCNAVASTVGVLGRRGAQVRAQDSVHRQDQPQRAADLPNKFQQILFAQVEQAWEMGAVAVGATVYFGSDELRLPQIEEIPRHLRMAHSLGMATILWCYLRNPAFKKDKGFTIILSARPDGPGEPSGRHNRSRHHQAEASRRSTAATQLNYGKTSPKVHASWSLMIPSLESCCRWSNSVTRGVRQPDQTPAGPVQDATTSRTPCACGDQQAGRCLGLSFAARPSSRLMKVGRRAVPDDPGCLPLRRGDGGPRRSPTPRSPCLFHQAPGRPPAVFPARLCRSPGSVAGSRWNIRKLRSPRASVPLAVEAARVREWKPAEMGLVSAGERLSPCEGGSTGRPPGAGVAVMFLQAAWPAGGSTPSRRSTSLSRTSRKMGVDAAGS